MRNTRQRNLVLDIINNSYNHPTAYQVYEECIKEIPNISLGTVYRNLNSLVDNNLIRKIPMSDGNDRFDKTLYNHNHIYCYKCDKLYDVNVLLSKKEINFIENETGFKITDCNFNINGICKDCIKKGS